MADGILAIESKRSASPYLSSHRASGPLRLLFLRNQRNESQQIFDAKVRASGGDCLKHTTRRYIGPSSWNVPEFALLVVKVDAILTPGLAALNELEPFPTQWMEGACDPKIVRLIDRIMCS
jgi:hypothetical protein